MKFLHTMIRIKNLENSLKFYTELLDFKLHHKMRLEDCWLYFLQDSENTCQIELTLNDEIPEKGYDIGKGFGHFALEVKSFNEFSSKLKNLGYEYLYEPFDLTPDGPRIAFLKDPDGYEIELIEG